MTELTNIFTELSLEDEIWKECLKYPGYFVSSEGRLRTPSSHISRATPEKKSGYIQVSVKDFTGKRSMQSLHRIVAETFIPNPENKPEVDHINGIRSNAKVSNLRWATRIENASNKIFPNYVPKNRPIDQYDLDDNFIKTWKSVKDILEFYKYNIKTLRQACQGKIDTCGGYKWYYHDEKLVIIDEKWIDFKIKNKNIQVSSAGRILTVGGRKTYGSCRTNNQGKDSYMDYMSLNVHRIVMLAFHPREDANKLCVDHIDANKKNNALSNLRWATYSENSQHAHNMGAYTNRNLATKAVIQLSKEGKFIKKFESISDASREVNTGKSHISKCCKGRRNTCAGFKWVFESEYNKE
uniref:HNH nuclease domain-containing protein n=1 Tax=viral metagenome TaxID=1070528 RepID=A0A6C0AER1_9ZZZZ